MIYFIDKTFLLVMSGEVEIIVKRDIYLQEIKDKRGKKEEKKNIRLSLI